MVSNVAANWYTSVMGTGIVAVAAATFALVLIWIRVAGLTAYSGWPSAGVDRTPGAAGSGR